MALDLAASTTPRVRPKPRASALDAVLAKSKALAKEVVDCARDVNHHLEKLKTDEMSQRLKQKKSSKRNLGVITKVAMEGFVDLDTVSSRLTDCLAKLQKQHYGFGANLLVCQRRLELRECRAPQESDEEDPLQRALSHEHEVLKSSRKMMLVLGGEIMLRMEECANLRGDLCGELAQTKLTVQAKNKDEQTILNSFANEASASVRSSPLVKSPPSMLGSQVGVGSPTFSQREVNMQNHGLHVVALRESCEDLETRTERLLKESLTVASQALRLVTLELKRSTSNLAEVTRTIRQHICDATHSLIVAERSLEKSARKLDPHITESLDKFTASRDKVEELRALKKELEDQLWTKANILNIDVACRRVTKHQAADRPLNASTQANSMMSSRPIFGHASRA